MLLEILETFNYEPQLAMPLPLLAIAAVGAAGQVVSGIIASNKANKAKTDAKILQDQLTDLENSRQDIYNASQDIKDLAGQITNPYANLPVATQAAEMQAEQADLALANTLDSMQAGGFGAGGATALAQAAARSKRGISANIEQQEARNNQLKAQGEISVQNQRLALEQAAIGAETQAWRQQENRELMQLDRTQALIDNQMAQQMQYQADAMGAFTGAAGSLTQMGIAGAGIPGVGAGGNITEQTNWTGPQGGPPTIQQPRIIPPPTSGNINNPGGANVGGVINVDPNASIFSGNLGGIGSSNINTYPSDLRLKKNISKIGKSKSGLNIYEFDYIDKEGTYQGVMSNEVPEEAVLVGINGYDVVDYSKVDVDFKRIK